jgi:hypothetical protein
MTFVVIHVIWFSCWIGFGVESYPYGLLTMIDNACQPLDSLRQARRHRMVGPAIGRATRRKEER